MSKTDGDVGPTITGWSSDSFKSRRGSFKINKNGMPLLNNLSYVDKTIQDGKNTGPKKINGWPADSFKLKNSIKNDISVSLSPDNVNFHYTQHLPTLNNQRNEPQNKTLEKGKNFISQFEKYCKISTLHGLRYVGDSQFSFGARIFWFIAFSLAIGFASYFITNIYTKWRSSPVIISYSPFDSNINTIPFPAITICNMNQAKRNEAENILRKGSILENKLLDEACDGNTTFNSAENISWDKYREFLIRVGNSCSDMVKLCLWGGHRVKCEEYFKNELTDEGLCCSFNRLPPEYIFRNWKEISILNQTYNNYVYDWNPEIGFPDVGSDDYVPRKASGAGPNMGLSVIVDAQVDNYYCSSTQSTGFKVMMSSPRESPKVADFGFLVGPGFDNNVFIEPLVRIASPSIRSIPIEKRQCYFTNERPLEYYRSYTQRNCLLECQSKYTFSLCHCVPYYLPKNKSIKYCSKKEKNCLESVTRNGLDCHCLPSCFSVTYPYGKSMSYLYRTIYDDLPNVTGQYFGENMAVMHFFFQSPSFTAELKSELFGFTENLSNTGGLLSLFLGFSFLSLVEIIYFVSLRVCCDIAKHRKKEAKLKKKKSALKF